MGFLDKMKQGMADAQAAASQMGNAMQMPTGDDMAYAQLAQRLNAGGVSTPATITSVTPTGRTDMGGGAWHSVAVHVEPDGGAAYDATFTQSLLPAQVSGMAPGTRINVKVDPADPNAMLMM
jgi:hypothetical protein